MIPCGIIPSSLTPNEAVNSFMREQVGLSAGDCVLVEPNEKHFVVGKSEKSEVVVICTPAWDKNDSFYD